MERSVEPAAECPPRWALSACRLAAALYMPPVHAWIFAGPRLQVGKGGVAFHSSQ